MVGGGVECTPDFWSSVHLQNCPVYIRFVSNTTGVRSAGSLQKSSRGIQCTPAQFCDLDLEGPSFV